MAREEAERRLGELYARLETVEARLSDASALHAATVVVEWVPCPDHRTAPRAWQEQCGMCAHRPVLACTNRACCGWPCAVHLSLHGETEETCEHREVAA